MDAAEKKALEQAVYDIVRLIPPGRATSYGAIARAVGFSNFSRMVGRIMSQCDSASTGVPAHRVINSKGILTAAAAFGPAGRMQQLLEAEGVEVRSGRIVNWKRVFWDPMQEI